MFATKIKLVCLVTMGTGCIATIGYIKSINVGSVPSSDATTLHRISSTDANVIGLTRRERRYLQFASVEHSGQIYMTPQDFLQSVLEVLPPPCLRRRILSNDEIVHFLGAVPSVKSQSSASNGFFRKLSERGIISYPEYLFLLSVLTKPEAGFRIAFNMFDRDGNERVDQNEFLIIRNLLGRSIRQRKVNDETRKLLRRLVPNGNGHGRYHHMKNGPAKTTLQVHFFGGTGAEILHYVDFHRFMKNLQCEVLRIEFDRYSGGSDRISDLNFARILLQYTHLSQSEYGKYLDRVHRLEHHQDITFHDFEHFCRSLHNLDDFAVAARFFLSAKMAALSREEFTRAVRICCGSTPSDHLINIVFTLFDADGDGVISHDEFWQVMQNKLRFRYEQKSVGWRAFKRCYRQEKRNLMTRM